MDVCIDIDRINQHIIYLYVSRDCSLPSSCSLKKNRLELVEVGSSYRL